MRPSKRDAHGLRPPLHDGLGRQHVRQFRGADAEGQGAEATVCAGVTVAAHDQTPRQAQAKLRPHHVHDALSGLVDVEQADAGSARLLAQGLEQLTADGGGANPARSTGDGMVRRREGKLRTVNGQSALFQVEQAAGAAKVVQQMPIDVQQVGIVAKIGHHVGIPNLGQLRAGMHERASPFNAGGKPQGSGCGVVPRTTWRRSPRRNPANAFHPQFPCR